MISRREIAIAAVAVGVGITATFAATFAHRPATLRECMEGGLGDARTDKAIGALLYLCRKDFPEQPVAQTLTNDQLQAEAKRRGWVVNTAPKPWEMGFEAEPEQPKLIPVDFDPFAPPSAEDLPARIKALREEGSTYANAPDAVVVEALAKQHAPSLGRVEFYRLIGRPVPFDPTQPYEIAPDKPPKPAGK